MEYARSFQVLAVALLATTALTTLASGEAGKPGSVKLDLYVMSQCPFGTKAEDVIFPVVRSLAPHVNFNLHFIASEVPAPPASPGVKPAIAAAFNSMHGQGEVEENLRHLCAMKNFPQQYMDFILERNISIAKGPDWQAAA